MRALLHTVISRRFALNSNTPWGGVTGGRTWRLCTVTYAYVLSQIRTDRSRPLSCHCCQPSHTHAHPTVYTVSRPTPLRRKAQNPHTVLSRMHEIGYKNCRLKIHYSNRMSTYAFERLKGPSDGSLCLPQPAPRPLT